MIIKNYIHENAFGNLVNFKLYQPVIPSNDYLICLHGIGECGPADGSELNLVARHGYPKHAQAGFEFPFNIVAPQVVSSYSALRKFFAAFVKLRFKADTIIVTGLSMGGFATFDMKYFDNINIIHAIAPVCGGASPVIAAEYPETIGWVFHGEADTTVRYARSKTFVDAYNETHETKMQYTLYPGVAHNAWDKAYRILPTNEEVNANELLLWITSLFAIAKPLDFKQKFIKFINTL